VVTDSSVRTGGDKTTGSGGWTGEKGRARGTSRVRDCEGCGGKGKAGVSGEGCGEGKAGVCGVRCGEGKAGVCEVGGVGAGGLFRLGLRIGRCGAIVSGRRTIVFGLYVDIGIFFAVVFLLSQIHLPVFGSIQGWR